MMSDQVQAWNAQEDFSQAIPQRNRLCGTCRSAFTSRGERLPLAEGLDCLREVSWLGFYYPDTAQGGSRPRRPRPSPIHRSRPVAKSRKVMKRKITPPVAAFKDVAAEAGVNWTQSQCFENGKMYFPESMGTGVAWVDWDNDLVDPLY